MTAPARTRTGLLAGLALLAPALLHAQADPGADESRYAAPSPRAPYVAENVRFEAADGAVLAGTLTLPKPGDRPAPAVVLIAGSGRIDRDAEVIPGYRPFRQIADTLGRRGVATLRFDKRGVGASTGDFGSATTPDFAADVRAALAYLRSRPEIDPARLGLVGHSEGGVIAPLVAVEEPSLAGVALIAAPSRSLREVLPAQVRHNVETDPSIPEAARDSVATALFEAWTGRASIRPWIEWLLDYDPLPTAGRVSVPVLLLAGAHDWQVPPEAAEELARAFREGGNPDVTTVILPNANHLLLADPDRHPGEYEDLPSRAVVPAALGRIADWVVDRVAGGGR